MIIRIVKMTFEEEYVSRFLENFEKHKTLIRNFEGCNYLELLQDVNDPNIFFTHSKWDAEENLNEYRSSELFKTVWAFTKKGFSAKPEAWSLSTLKALA